VNRFIDRDERLLGARDLVEGELADGLRGGLGGKVVKHIGDALMLAFRRADDAVGFARGLHEAARRDEAVPGLRVGMHRGPAIYRAGDYIGTTVNLASRVTGTATAGQTVLRPSPRSSATGRPSSPSA